MVTAARPIPQEVIDNSTASMVEAATRVLRSGAAPGKAAFVARALNLLAQVTEAAEERELANIAGAPSDFLVLYRLLDDPVAIAELRRQDPLFPAKLRGVQGLYELLEREGGVLTAEQTAQWLGITRQAVDKRRKAGKLLGLSLGRRGYVYPAWQLSPDGDLLPGLEEVLAALDENEHTVLSKMIFMLGPSDYLDDQSPLACMRRGCVVEVVRAARAYGEHGAA